MKKGIFSVLSILFFTLPLYSQFQNVRITAHIYGEEWISINPKNPNQMVTGVIGIYTPANSMMGYYYTTNAGLNWSGGPMLTTLGEPGSDPVVLVDTAGYFYYICCANYGVPGPNLDKFFCFKSTNGGMNWDNGTEFAHIYHKMDDMPMGCMDFSNSIYKNNLYVTWTLYDTMLSHNPADSSFVYFTSSTNSGASFTEPKRISRVAGHGYYDYSNPEGPVPCTGYNGEVYVCFPYDSLILFNRSTDAGNSWLTDDIIVSRQVGSYFLKHSPVVTCDLSNSLYKGNVYIVFSDLRNGANDRDIWFTKSTNRGDSWGTVVRVNNDSPGHDQELPWICVDRVTGYIWIVFYDSRNSVNQIICDAYVARSTDGGNTFQNVRASNSNFYMGNWYGEYMGISAYNNVVRPVWSKSSVGELWTAIIDSFVIGIQKISNEIPLSFTLSQNFPNPFNPATTIKFSLPKAAFTKVTVYDALGREDAVIVNELLNVGSYETSWNAENFPSGVYFYKIESGDYTASKKMILIK